MKIGIIGSGSMGRTLGKLWAHKGHHIFQGSRSPERLGDALNHPHIEAGSYAEAAAFADTVLLATGWDNTENALRSVDVWAGKVLIDCTNAEVFGNGVPYHHAVGYTTSAAEMIAGWAPGADVVKAFNHLYGSMLEKGTTFNTTQVASFYCGNAAAAKSSVKQLGTDLGLEMIDVGNLSMARYLEPLSALLVHLVIAGIAPGEDIVLTTLRR